MHYITQTLLPTLQERGMYSTILDFYHILKSHHEQQEEYKMALMYSEQANILQQQLLKGVII